MFSYKRLSSIVLLGLVASCASSLPTSTVSDKRDFKVSAFWAQDTLAKPNIKFRKVNRMTPIIHKKSVIVGNAFDGLIAYDVESKSEKWRINIPQGVEASGTAVNDTLFIGGLSGKMYSVNMNSGSVNWFFDTKTEIVSEPLLNEGIVYFMAGSQSLYAVDGISGKQIWSYSRQDTSGNMTIRGGSRPALNNGILYVGFSDGSMVAISAQTGTEQWEITLNRNSKFKDIDSSPVIAEDLIFINSYDDKLYCLSKNKGEIIWSSPFGGASTPLVIDDRVYTTSSRGELVSLNKKDGALVWKKETKNGIFADPSVFSDLIVAGESQGKLVFVEKLTGRTRGSFEPGRGVFTKPAIVDTNLYFVSGEGNLYGVNAQYQNVSSIYYLR